jgi:hypothetical protein
MRIGPCGLLFDRYRVARYHPGVAEWAPGSRDKFSVYRLTFFGGLEEAYLLRLYYERLEAVLA